MQYLYIRKNAVFGDASIHEALDTRQFSIDGVD